MELLTLNQFKGRLLAVRVNWGFQVSTGSIFNLVKPVSCVKSVFILILINYKLKYKKRTCLEIWLRI